MRTGVILAVAVLLLIVTPTAGRAQAQFGAPPPGGRSLGPTTFHMDFRAQKDILSKKPVQPLNHSVNPVPPVVIGSNPIDCGIIKRVDPRFKSVMPIVKPDPKVQLPMKTIQSPACKR
jgi:hypothetical protein